MYGPNRDEKLRDEIIFGKHEPDKYLGGIRRFEGLKISQLFDLFCNHFITWDERHNAAPDLREIVGYIAEHPGYGMSGYAVAAQRDDYRVSIDGLEKEGVAITKQEQEDFKKLFGAADDFEASSRRLYAWYD